jgi:hypothetical protein
MLILPEFVRSMLDFYREPITQWFSEQIYREVAHRARRHLLIRLQERLDLGEIEAACRDYHHQNGAGSQPTHGVAKLVRALLVKYLYDWSLRETEERISHDLVIKHFVGYGLLEPVMDHSGLDRFEQWVNRHHHRIFFDGVLHMIDRDFPAEREQVQIGDTFAMHANAAREEVAQLLRHTSRYLLRELREQEPEVHQAIWQALDPVALFGPEDEGLLYFLDAHQREARRENAVRGALQLGQLARPLLNALAEPLRVRVRLRLDDLDKIIQDNFRVTSDPQSGAVQVVALAKGEKGAYQICSATDREATCRNHGGQSVVGYNVGLAVTPNTIIREIQAATGAEPDSQGVAPLIEQQCLYQHLCPPKFIYDQAAGMGRTRARVQLVSNGQTQLVARIPPVPSGPYFRPDQFTLSADGLGLTCPNHCTSDHVKPDKDRDGRTFSFPRKVCRGCPLWDQCRNPQIKRVGARKVFVSDYQEQIRQAQAYNATETFKTEMKLRPIVERVILMLTHYDGARLAKGRGNLQADFQAKMSATGRNLRTWLSLWDKKEQRERVGATIVA